MKHRNYTDNKESRHHAKRSSAILASARWFCERVIIPIALAVIAHWPKI